jgi:hypothetical protein
VIVGVAILSLLAQNRDATNFVSLLFCSGGGERQTTIILNVICIPMDPRHHLVRLVVCGRKPPSCMFGGVRGHATVVWVSADSLISW